MGVQHRDSSGLRVRLSSASPSPGPCHWHWQWSPCLARAMSSPQAPSALALALASTDRLSDSCCMTTGTDCSTLRGDRSGNAMVVVIALALAVWCRRHEGVQQVPQAHLAKDLGPGPGRWGGTTQLEVPPSLEAALHKSGSATQTHTTHTRALGCGRRAAQHLHQSRIANTLAPGCFWVQQLGSQRAGRQVWPLGQEKQSVGPYGQGPGHTTLFKRPQPRQDTQQGRLACVQRARTR